MLSPRAARLLSVAAAATLFTACGATTSSAPEADSEARSDAGDSVPKVAGTDVNASRDEPVSRSSPAEVAATSASANPACNTAPRITPEALAAFGRAAVFDAHCEVIDLVERTTFDTALLNSTGGDLDALDLGAWRSHMTAESRQTWDRDVNAATGRGADEQALADVWALVFFDTLSGSGFEFADDQEPVQNPSISPADLYTDEVTRPGRLFLSVETSAGLNLTQTSTGDSFQGSLGRTLRMTLAKNPDPAADEDNSWIIETYTATFDIGEPTPR